MKASIPPRQIGVYFLPLCRDEGRDQFPSVVDIRLAFVTAWNMETPTRRSDPTDQQ
jgi:hypothetical protein